MSATPTPTLLIDLWREVCRNLDIGASVQMAATHIATTMPLRRLLVRTIDVEHNTIETIAQADLDAPPLATTRTCLNREDIEVIARWLVSGQVVGWRSNESSRLRALVAPVGSKSGVIAGPLGDGSTTDGMLVIELEEEPQPHLSLVQTFLDPFTVALMNDRRIHEVVQMREAAEAQNRALLTRLQRQDIADAIVGAESGLREVMERVEQVARTDVPVLILGETGSGKEVVARSIHGRSLRAAGPFLRVNCGAIPPELVDSELFGHERGSFTGAIAARQGWFERADGGTLFLDEVGELPAAAQVRLLRVLQDGRFERVGGHHERMADVRIVAATHRDMQTMVRDAHFREDLWYRISVFPIRLPPLRERREDIAALAGHFASRAGIRLFGVPLLLSPEETRLLHAYDWPGNVRELAAVIERAAILGDGRKLDLRSALGVLPTGKPQSQLEPGVGALETANWKVITDALTRTNGRIEGPFGAALLLGINPHTLRSRMRKMGIDWSTYRNSH